MIHYNNLYITEDSKYLVIDVAIDEESYYEDVYLDKIGIDTQDTFVPNGPSDKAKVFTISKNELNRKHIKLCLTSKELGVNLSKDMLFVYTIATGTPAPDTPCNYDVNKILSVVVNTYEVYKSIIPLIKEISNQCKEPLAFIDRELQIKAVEYALRSSNYLLAIKYWKRYFMNNNIVPSSNKCTCNGNS